MPKSFGKRNSYRTFCLGFTLPEILIALTIMVILATMGFSALKTIQPSLKLSGTARNLVTDLRYAQQLAVSEQTDYGVLFSTTTEQKYQIIKHESADTIIKEENLPNGMSFYNITPLIDGEIRFNPYGAAREEGIITLINEGGATTTIRVSPSGFIKILD